MVPVGGARSAGSGCGACGRREACGVWLWCLWAAAGPGRASRSTTPSEARVWRSRGRAAAHRRNRPDQVGRLRGDGGRCEVCGAWLWCLWAAVGPRRTTPSDERAARGLRGLAGLRDDAPSEARGADGERAGRPRAARKCGGGAAARKRGGGGAARKRGGEAAARKRGRQEFSVRRRRSRRGRLRNRSRMGRCGPGGSRGRSRRLRRLRRCRGRGRGRRRRRPGRV